MDVTRMMLLISSGGIVACTSTLPRQDVAKPLRVPAQTTASDYFGRLTGKFVKTFDVDRAKMLRLEVTDDPRREPVQSYTLWTCVDGADDAVLARLVETFKEARETNTPIDVDYVSRDSVLCLLNATVVPQALM